MAFAANVLNKKLSENEIYWQQHFQAEPELELNSTIAVNGNISMGSDISKINSTSVFQNIEYMLQFSD